MAGQGPERREVLRMLAIAAAASEFPGFSRWSYAQDHHTTIPAPKPANYKPQFFSAEDYKLIAHLSELIIPSDETPGAREAGVSEFIDFMVASDPAVQDSFRTGITWLNEQARAQNAYNFLALDATSQAAILDRLAFRARYQTGDEDGQKFFRLVRKFTLMGYYTTRIGLEQLDAPCLKLYSDSPGCPHKDDPEHKHLHTAA